MLPYGETTQLGHVLDLARECPLDQRLCAIGGGAQHVRATVDLTGIDVVDNPEYGRAAPRRFAAAADGRGHPLALAGGTFADLATLHGDEAVWKLMDRYGSAVVDVPIDGPIPRDIDTWEDDKALAVSSSA